MSESEKRTPISVYLTPKAAMILREYNEGSGYGSLSRTVEEIILAFDITYKSIKDLNNTLDTYVKKGQLSQEDVRLLYLLMLSSTNSISNTLSRLQPSTSF